MLRTLGALAALILLLVPAAAHAAGGDPDRSFGQRGTLTLKTKAADAGGGAVHVIAGHKILAGGVAQGKLVVLRARKSGSLDSGFGGGGQVAIDLPGTSLNGVQALDTFRDGRIVVAATLQPASGGTQIAVVRLEPNGEIDPSFGGGLGYVLVGPGGSTLGSMVLDRNGDVLIAAGRSGGGAEIPWVMRLAPDGSPDATFGTGGMVDMQPWALTGMATGIIARPDGTTVFCTGAGPATAGASTFTVGRLGPTGGLDTNFGGTGLVTYSLTPYVGQGAGAAGIVSTSKDRLIVAGTDVTEKGTERGVAMRLLPNGLLDRHFADHGISRIARAGRNLRVTAVTHDSKQRIVLAGTGDPPDSLLVRLHEGGKRDASFGNGGLTYPKLGRPPGGAPVYTSIDAIAADGTKVITVGSAAGPGVLTRSWAGPTVFSGRFALTLSRLD